MSGVEIRVFAIGLMFVFVIGYVIGRGSAEVETKPQDFSVLEENPPAPKAEPPETLQRPPPGSLTTATRPRFTESPSIAFSCGPTFQINWEHVDAQGYYHDGARVAEVLEAAAKQLEFQQASPRACNENAKALFALLQALDALNGTNEVTSLGAIE